MKLKTERLILRHWEERDRAPLAAVLGDPEVRRFYPTVLNAAEAGAQFDRALRLQADNGYHFGAAELRTTGEFVGLVGLGRIGDPLRSAIAGAPEVEIGWQFATQFWGQGLAPEAAKALLRHGFVELRLREIVAFTWAGNQPSRRVMEKAGMQYDPEADFAHPGIAEGHRLRPHVLYRLASPALGT